MPEEQETKHHPLPPQLWVTLTTDSVNLAFTQTEI